MNAKKDCFLICPIGGAGSEERKRSDMLLKYVLEPTCSELGYTISRADMMPKSGIITSQILTTIVDAPLVVADLTGGNPNVFYELALRHAVNKPYIQLIEENQIIPFDVSVVRTIKYNLGDLDAVERTKAELSKQIEMINTGHKPDSPISIALKSQVLGIPDNVLEVFLEKFWNIEDDLLRVNKCLEELTESTKEDLKSDLEWHIENKIDDAVKEIIAEINKDT